VHPPTTRQAGPGLKSRVLSRVAAFSLVAASLVCAGCGPFGYLKKVATDASRAVADAEAAGAEEYAPYEYWGAVAYLEQAKVLMGYSEYERSFDFGQRATQLANEAKVKAQRVKKGGSVVHDESVTAPTDMVDAEGNKIESIDEANEREDAGEEKSGANTDTSDAKKSEKKKPPAKAAKKKGGEG
jgi:hypothetical protein